MEHISEKVKNDSYLRLTMAKKISFLLGAGFSCPAGYPTASDLSKKIADKIQSFVVREEQSVERNLFEFYEIVKTLRKDADFDYEWFYDSITFVTDALTKYSNCIKFFGSKGEELLSDRTPLMEVLEKKGVLLEDMSKIKGLYSDITRSFLAPDECKVAKAACYRDFIDFLVLLRTQGCEIEIHTLNHDLLLEGLLRDGHSEFSDGYAYPKNSEVVVAYEGGGFSSEKVFARVFNSQNFDSQINLCKLHGSLDSYWVCDIASEYTVLGFENSVKVVSKCSKEPVFSRGHFVEGSFRFVEDCGVVVAGHSDFLTGTTSKLRQYGERHYKVMFRKFEENIRNADAIIVIGYGWRDLVINDVLKKIKHGCRVVSVCDKDNARVKDVLDGSLPSEDPNDISCDDMCSLPDLEFSRLEDVNYRNVANLLEVCSK